MNHWVNTQFVQCIIILGYPLWLFGGFPTIVDNPENVSIYIYVYIFCLYSYYIYGVYIYIYP